MAEIYGFFPDVLYGADDFTGYFRDFYSNGIMGDNTQNFQAYFTMGMYVNIKHGTAYIDGHFFKPTTDTPLKLASCDTEYSRIDIVVIRCDYIENKVYLKVITGEPSANPQMPSFKRDTEAYDLVLCSIFVDANITAISQSDITDLRFNTDYCGIVTGKINTINTTELFAQYDAQWELLKGACKNDADKVISAWDSLIAVKTINNTAPVNGNIDLTQGDIPAGKNAFQMPYYVQSGTVTMPNTASSPSYKGVTMTFPVAFESTPTLLISVKDPGWVNNNRSVSVAFDDLSKTGAHIRAWSGNQSAVMQTISCTVHWVAFGKI